jgi:hypothetical protein
MKKLGLFQVGHKTWIEFLEGYKVFNSAPLDLDMEMLRRSRMRTSRSFPRMAAPRSPRNSIVGFPRGFKLPNLHVALS